MATSSELITLCQAQVSLITGLGASLSVVYLAEDWAAGQPGKLIPIAAYPEIPRSWSDDQVLIELPQLDFTWSVKPSLLPSVAPQSETIARTQTEEVESLPDPPPESDWEDGESHQKQVLPLIHDQMVMGFLVTGRDDRPWNSQEQRQLRAIAHTLTTACILDRRSQWLQQEVRQQYQLQSQEYQTLQGLLHQLKSPLTALRTFGKLLLKRLSPDDRNYKLADNILSQSDRIEELLQQVDRTAERGENLLSLPFSSIEDSQTPTVEYVTPTPEPPTPVAKSPVLLPATDIIEPIKVQEIINPLWTATCAIADERQLICIAEIPLQVPTVRGNAKALREVMSNLLDNALKYTPGGGEIYLKVAQNYAIDHWPEPGVAIAISDTGPGIPPGDRDRLFERGYRGIQAQGNIPGTGLGLAIVQDLLKPMQGEIQVYSPCLPQWLPQGVTPKTEAGTTFIIGLPVTFSRSRVS
ncbi:MAG: HAMP domain-containing histidine kinase [Arthrospira sp. SH-MAG29]|nr:HAMP domain-containing sensor histidine kinase [Arthrospira sp. SH-MAG29]MBS0016231.1 HAMP domain-containing histidine kinase [Arthrospira sp. SH-MAG29]